jgi:hypothetical protein
MISLELLVVESQIDAFAASFCDIFDFVSSDTECDVCGILVGPVAGEFFPCVLANSTSYTITPDGLVSTEDSLDSHVVVSCMDCVGSLLFSSD